MNWLLSSPWFRVECLPLRHRSVSSFTCCCFSRIALSNPMLAVNWSGLVSELPVDIGVCDLSSFQLGYAVLEHVVLSGKSVEYKVVQVYFHNV